MAYLITFSENADWMIQNIRMAWIVEKLTENIDDPKLVEFIEITTYINGVDFSHDYGDDNHLRDQYLELLRERIPELIKRENTPFISHLEELEKLLKV